MPDSFSQSSRTATSQPPRPRPKAPIHQAEAAYQIETTSALPEEWQKAEYDLKAAKENFDAQQKIYDSRKKLYDEGALPRKDYDQSLVALTQAKSQYEIASMHMTALQSAGKKQQLKSAEGQLTSAKGKYEGAAAQLALLGNSQPHRRRGYRPPNLSGRNATAGHAAAHGDGHLVGHREGAYPAGPGRATQGR